MDDIWDRVLDRMSLEGDADRRDQIVRRSLDGRGEEAAVYRFRKLPVGVSHAFAARQTDRHGHAVKVEFAYGWCTLGSIDYETTAGQLRKNPDGSWTGEVMVSAPEHTRAFVGAEDEPSLLPHQLLESLDSGVLSAERAGTMARLLVQHLEGSLPG